MTITIEKDVADYFRNGRNLAIKANKVGEYFNLRKLSDINIKFDHNGNQTVLIEVDESELDNEYLKSENILNLMAIYAMGIGE
jgi:hypothetical protein